MSFSYFDFGEEGRFSFLQVPKILLTGKRYSRLSGDAKILYSLMLDRLGLSRKNGWYDERGHPFIYFTIEDVTESLGIGHSKAASLLTDLEGAELILRVRQGLCRPNRIYVGRFYRDGDPAEIRNSENRKSGGPKNRIQEIRDPDTNHTEHTKTEKNKTIKPGPIPFHLLEEGGREAEIRMLSAYLDMTCGFEELKKEYPGRKDELDRIKALMVETCTSDHPTIRVGRQEKAKGVVESRLKKLNIDHIRYVMDCMENAAKVTNMRRYLLTVLYNAPVSMGAHGRPGYGYDRARGIV